MAAKKKPQKAQKGELINGIRFNLEGEVEVSLDHGQTWKPFTGIVINAALIEYSAEIDYIRKQRAQEEDR